MISSSRHTRVPPTTVYRHSFKAVWICGRYLFLDTNAANQGRHLGERHVGRRFGAHWDAVCVFHVRGAAETAGELRGAGAHCAGAFHAAKWVKVFSEGKVPRIL